MVTIMIMAMVVMICMIVIMPCMAVGTYFFICNTHRKLLVLISAASLVLGGFSIGQ
ncbi:hypothetical protein TREPR_3290 [Treponema primitia ZAS-2]|uniref:Uncharacterized protein n=1 Tax=Treponema primitia (strain ATCC BAA-887 / DSM 12427 / ZAS-2) TaxID=545694 RepID=F5YKC5_TREPZ|nr:hypothetical protein TREPR_3290 [Treponema primitia ZAS-2]